MNPHDVNLELINEITTYCSFDTFFALCDDGDQIDSVDYDDDEIESVDSDDAWLAEEPLDDIDENANVRDREPASDLIASCSYLRRLITVLRYFELLRISNGREKGCALFGEFCAEYYPMFLRDYIHFTRTHLNDVETIKE